MQRNNRWLLVGAGAFAGLLLLSSSKTVSTGGEIDASEADLDNLARMIIAETSFSRDKMEMAQIVWVAINRARGRGKTLSQVVIPPGDPVWNTGSVYASRFNSAASSPRFLEARAFVSQVLAGEWPNLIGGRRMFVHPSGMPTPPCAANRKESSTSSGQRCLPEWVLNGKQVGGALFA